MSKSHRRWRGNSPDSIFPDLLNFGMTRNGELSFNMSGCCVLFQTINGSDAFRRNNIPKGKDPLTKHGGQSACRII